MMRRSTYMVLSPRSLPYGKIAIESLLARSSEPVSLRLITDSNEDRDALTTHMETASQAPQHAWSVHTERDLEEQAAERFGRYANLRAFRRGHPCWRKITDPLLLSESAEEMIVLDPDLYFPNTFSFEATPRNELLLMWQKPNCLLPSVVVQRAMEANVRLADHVDIGIAQWRGPVDMEWMDWFIGALGGAALPRVMHIEAIVWAALALKMGGGHLDPQVWRCWHRTQFKRVMRLFKVKGETILRSEPWSTLQCFHGGGEAKWWIPEAHQHGLLATPASSGKAQGNGRIVPFSELTPGRYRREQSMKRVLRRMGYYSLFRAA